MIEVEMIKINKPEVGCFITPTTTLYLVRRLEVNLTSANMSCPNFWENLPNYIYVLRKLERDAFLTTCVKLGNIENVKEILNQIACEKGESLETEGFNFTFIFSISEHLTVSFTYDSHFIFLNRGQIGSIVSSKNDKSSSSMISPCQVTLEAGHFYFEPSFSTYFDLVKREFLK